MGQGSSGAGFTIGVQGINESLSILTKAGANVHGLDTGAVFQSNGHLRAAARSLAEDIARTTVRPLVAAGPAAQSAEMAGTIRGMSDRRVVIKVGATNPSLSGFTPGKASNRKWRGSLAWGVERGPGPGRPNVYGVARRESGHVIGPNMGLIEQRTIPRYRTLVLEALRAAGVTSFGRGL